MMDKVFNFGDLKVFVDATSVMYLNGCVVDYVETLEAAGFIVREPEREEHLRLRITSFQRISALRFNEEAAVAAAFSAFSAEIGWSFADEEANTTDWN